MNVKIAVDNLFIRRLFEVGLSVRDVCISKFPANSTRAGGPSDCLTKVMAHKKSITRVFVHQFVMYQFIGREQLISVKNSTIAVLVTTPIKIMLKKFI